MPYNAHGPRIKRKQWIKCILWEGHEWWEPNNGPDKICKKCKDARSKSEPFV